jgi:rare lipoprotein A
MPERIARLGGTARLVRQSGILSLGIAIAAMASGCGQRVTTATVPPAPNPTTQPSEATPPANSSNRAPASAPTNNGPDTGPNIAPAKSGGTPPLAAVEPPNAGVYPGSYVEHGVASWYGEPFHGRRAANGEIYDMNLMTAAHRTLPFNTLVRVTNLSNGEHVDVRITDRGPFVDDRIIDLSRAAAQAIDMVGPGTAPVRLEILSVMSNPAAGRFGVQVGAFADRTNAERLRDQLSVKYQPVTVQNTIGPNGPLYRVRVGSVPSEQDAQALAMKLQRESGLPAFVVRVDDTPPSGGVGGGWR